MKLIALIEKTDDNRYEVSVETVIANCYLYGLGATVDEAKSDFMQSVSDMQGFAAATNHPRRRAASRLKVEFRHVS